MTATWTELVGDDANRRAAGAPISVVSYHDQWRRLWVDQITWTRMAIIGILDDLPGTDVYLGRLIQSYEDMEDALAEFYPEELVEKIGDYLWEHLQIAAAIFVAAEEGDSEQMESLVAEWRTNADRLALALSHMNPNWSYGEARTIIQQYLDSTLEEAVKHSTDNFEGEVKVWESVHDGALLLADFISNGVIQHFPLQFKGFQP